MVHRPRKTKAKASKSDKKVNIYAVIPTKNIWDCHLKGNNDTMRYCAEPYMMWRNVANKEPVRCCLQHQISLAAAFCTLSSLSIFERPTWRTPLWSFLIFKQWTIRTQIFDDLPSMRVPFFSLLQLGSDVFHSIWWCSNRAIKTSISSSVVGAELSCVKVDVDVLGSRP